MGVIDITIQGLAFAFLLLGLPMLISLIFNLKIIKSAIISVIRMTVQLFLMALLLNYLFVWNIAWLNILWLLVMISVASYTVITNSNLYLKRFIIPTLGSFIFSTFLIILYFNIFIIRVSDIFQAKYLIIVSGMLLGNALRGNIVGLSNFYNDIKRNEERFKNHLAYGATLMEASLPYFQHALTSAVKPTIASMAAIGIVALPGMMTGQMLGGASPLIAIKYQISIMIAIFSVVLLATTLTLLFTLRSSFNEYGLLKEGVIKKK